MLVSEQGLDPGCCIRCAAPGDHCKDQPREQGVIEVGHRASLHPCTLISIVHGNFPVAAAVDLRSAILHLRGPMSAKKNTSVNRIAAENRRARYDYFIEDYDRGRYRARRIRGQIVA